MNLLETTRKLLKSRVAEGLSYPDIVRASNGSVGREWLYKFAAGEIPNPGVNTIQALHDTLKSITPPTN